MTKDYYKTLNINRDSSQDDIKKAFRTLSKQHHPDKGGNEQTFKEISEAYDTLSNPEKKQRYDTGGHNPFGQHNPFSNNGPGMDDIFKEFFGRNTRRQQVKKGENLNIPLRVDLEDVFFGVSKKIKYKKKNNCASCHGTGGENVTCGTCNGAGHIDKVAGNAFFRQVQRHQCGPCNGNGRIILNKCNYCAGSGGKAEETVVEFKIPQDLMAGQTFIFKNGGNEILGGQPGDLLIEIVINRHPIFKLVGKDLIYEPKISVIDMILGCKIEIPHFNGESRIQIPERTDITKVFTVANKGMNNPKGRNGNLVIKPRIVMPTQLNEDERKVLETLTKNRNFKI